MKNRIVKIAIGFSILILGAVLLEGCATSRLVDVWKSPEYDIGAVKKVVVIAAFDGKGQRRIWEDSFSKVLHKYGVEATPSYELFPKDIPTTDQIHSSFENKYDGILLVRKVNSRIVKHYVPGYNYWGPVGWMYNPFFWHYRMIYAEFHSPGYFTRDRVLTFEASLYQANDKGTLIWDATSEVQNPHSQKELVKELSRLIVPNMMNKQESDS